MWLEVSIPLHTWPKANDQELCMKMDNSTSQTLHHRVQLEQSLSRAAQLGCPPHECFTRGLSYYISATLMNLSCWALRISGQSGVNPFLFLMSTHCIFHTQNLLCTWSHLLVNIYLTNCFNESILLTILICSYNHETAQHLFRAEKSEPSEFS